MTENRKQKSEVRYEEHRCPLCVERCHASELHRKTVDGIRLRRWIGWCINCDMGFEVEQVLIKGHWLTSRYKTCARTSDMFNYDHSDWIELYPYPKHTWTELVQLAGEILDNSREQIKRVNKLCGVS